MDLVFRSSCHGSINTFFSDLPLASPSDWATTVWERDINEVWLTFDLLGNPWENPCRDWEV